MLVNQDIFDVVDFFLLIVGHTHASIDQYFSVLAMQIYHCDFIGSPKTQHYQDDCNLIVHIVTYDNAYS
jgi:hypothetical protein